MAGKTTTENKDFKNYVGCKTKPETDRAVREKLVTARIALLLKAPFFGNLATRLQLVNADAWCGTAATDGRKFYYNSEFLKNMPAKQLEFLIGHEVLHCVYDHMGRRGDRDPTLWNIADDYCVNQDLLDQRIGEKIPVGLYDQKYRGWSAEEVYDDLYENAEKIDVDDLVKQLLDEHLDGDGADEGQGQSEHQSGENRPHPPDGCHAAHAGAGAFGLCRPTRSRWLRHQPARVPAMASRGIRRVGRDDHEPTRHLPRRGRR